MENCHCHFQDTVVWSSVCQVNFMMTLETLFHLTENVSQSCSRLNPVDVVQDEYDFIVVGAGVAGAVVASRLSEVEDYSVLLVEAGPLEPTATFVPYLTPFLVNSAIDWNYTTEAQAKACLVNGGVCAWPRGKTVGGSSVFTGIMYVRGHPDDYVQWASNEEVSWDYDNILPYFKKSENQANKELDSYYHGFDGPLPIGKFSTRPALTDDIVAAAPEMEYEIREDINEGRLVTGFTVADFAIKDGLRTSTASAYLRPNRDRVNLDVTVNSMVSRVNIEGSAGNRVAAGVDIFFSETGETKTVKARKEVILSTGAINTPQLLMLSGVGPEQVLQSQGIEVLENLPVGQNLQNHVGVNVRFTINSTYTTDLTDDAVQQYTDGQTGPLATNGITQATAFISSTHADKGHADLQVFFDGFQMGCPSHCVTGEEPGCDRRPIDMRPTLVAPRSTGNVTLASKSFSDYPVLQPNYFSNDMDLDILLQGVQFVLDLAKTDALKKWDFQLNTTQVAGCEDYPVDDMEYWKCVIRTDTVPENHQSCTAKMGLKDDPTAVVDPALRVIGVPNLRVIDASVYPFVPRANPIASIIMIAEKGSDLVKQTWSTTTA